MGILGVTHSAPAFGVPAGACDCHVHVFGPVEKFPFAPHRVFTPGPAPVEDLIALQGALGEVIQSLPVPLVVDHFGRPDAAKGISQQGFAALLALVKSGKVYVKLSAPYRISVQPDYADAADVARALIEANPDRMLWGSDWPHPGGRPGVPRRPELIEPFRPEDDGAALNRLRSWTSDAAQLRKILCESPARLYGF